MPYSREPQIAPPLDQYQGVETPRPYAGLLETCKDIGRSALQQIVNSRMSRRAIAIGLATGLSVGATTEMISNPTDAKAIGGERAAILMPFDSGGRTWITGDGPDIHHHSPSVGWAADLHATPGTAVKARMQTNDGALSMSVAAITETCAAPSSAGKSVWVDINVDNTLVGRMVYGHLDNLQVKKGDPVTSSSDLGYLKLWNQSSCWQDTLADGLVHTHVQSVKGCYRSLAPTTNFAASVPIGLLSSEYSANNAGVCDENGISQATSGPVHGTQDGQEVTNNTWVYTKAGGSYWPIKHKSSWTAADTAHWGNEPIIISSQEITAHEAGYQDGVRYVGAHPPADGTTVYVEGGTGQQYYFVRGKAYPIGVGELADLGAVNQALRIPATDGRLYDFTSRQLNLDNGEVYRFAGTPSVRQVIHVGGSALSYHVNNDTVKDCLYLTQGRKPLILPQDAQWYLPVSDSGSNANCTFPPGMVLRGPGGVEQWRIEGNNPYTRRYFPSALLTYLHTSGNPNHQVLSSTASINNLPQGADMSIPEGMAFVDMGNGAEFLRQNGEWHYVSSPDMNTCLGLAPWQIVQVPSAAVGALPQGAWATCAYSNRVVAYSGVNYYIDTSGKSHPILNEAVKNCVVVRRGTGAAGDVSFNPTTQYPLGDAAYCPYETEPGLNFVQEGSNPMVWVLKVGEDGKLRMHHASGFCLDDPLETPHKKFHLFRVPVGELAGIPQSSPWSPTPQACAELPGDGLVVRQYN